YLKDIVNKRLQPICHRIIEGKFVEDKNYLKALSLATNEQREEYIRRADEIDYILSEFRAFAREEQRYDVFLCVKVTDNGSYTDDSHRAAKIYQSLKDSGYRPFYSEFCMGNRTGADYEAYILFVLHMAKKMLVICSHPDYLQTPWVKNEYTRFLNLKREEDELREAIAIVYDKKPIEKLPGERRKLQGIDFSSFDALDRIRAFLEKKVTPIKKKPAKKKPVPVRGTIRSKKKAEQQAKEEAERKAREEWVERHRADFVIENGVLQKYNGKGGDIVLSEGITSIGTYKEGDIIYSIFRKVPSIKSIVLPSSMTKINVFAFRGCSSLESVTIPESVTSIGSCAFLGCSSLESVTIGSSVTSIGDSAFSYCSSLESVTIGKGVTSIGKCAFSYCRSLQSVTIPDSVTSIGDWAFDGCRSLESITIGSGVTSIGDGAFSYCRLLQNVTIPDSVTSIGWWAFWKCSSLQSVTIGSGVTSIGRGAFRLCSSLQSVTIGSGVTSIELSAFHGCSSLKHVYYTGTKAQCDKIKIGRANDPLENATIHYNS
ncbi:MAG: leucine-rich repeat protein, partial [Christensenellaceae bacterium]